jgi:hypothetical protein
MMMMMCQEQDAAVRVPGGGAQHRMVPARAAAVAGWR